MLAEPILAGPILAGPTPAKRLRLFASLFVMLCSAVAALSHPMGNFSVNHYSKIDVQSNKIEIRYFIDLAEIPTYQELQQGNIPTTPMPGIDDPAVKSYVAGRGLEMARNLSLLVDDKPIALRMSSSGVLFPPGAGGLPTMKMGFTYEAVLPPSVSGKAIDLLYSDSNYPGHTGWKEIIAVSTVGKLLHSTVPVKDRSNELSNYPTDLLSSPPQDLSMSLEAELPVIATSPEKTVTVAAPTPLAASRKSPQIQVSAQTQASPQTRIVREAYPARVVPSASTTANTLPTPTPATTLTMQANRQRTPRDKFTELISAQHLSLWFLLTAALIAMGLGGLHALEPGHGKTIVAAYLVGSRGTARHAALLGMIVTVSHTAGVFALGAITLYASRYIVPEQLYPWLGVLSGMVIAGLGLYMFLRRWTGTATDHSHADGATHKLWFFSKSRPAEEIETGQAELANGVKKHVSLTQLLMLGITGGIIPCPAALIVLLSAFALHRIALGFFLIVAFSVGLAAVLIGFGLLMVYARRMMTHLQVDGPLTSRWLPLLSSGFITVLGSILMVQAFAATHFDLHAFSKEKIGPLLFVAGLGLLLGVRHSTDTDHVVAISTIVSKQRSIRNAAVIGSVWGIGHTVTVFIVGSLIILFGVEIPPRLGLSMEFSVAIMLILLGILNLSGWMQKITARLKGVSSRSIEVIQQSSKKDASSDKAVVPLVVKLGWYQYLRPLVIGLVHGLAGSAAVALLVLSTIHNPYWALVYLVIFGFGTLIGMVCMTALIAMPLTYAGDRYKKLGHYFQISSGLVSVGFGSFLVYQLGFVAGLFTSHPQWTPQ